MSMRTAAVSYPEKHRPLASTWLFWVALTVPLLLGATLGVLISISTNSNELCFKPDCVERFFYIFKFPIAIAGLSLPLIAMVAAIHRSNEASLQIKISSSQYEEAIKNNRFGNYLKHRESFDKLIDGHCSATHYGEKCKIIVRKQELYSSLFPDSGPSNLDWSGEYSAERFELGEMCAKLIIHLSQTSKENFDAEPVIESIYAMQKLLQINYSPFKAVEIEPLGENPARNIVLPGQSSIQNGLALAALDCLSMLAIIRSYIGKNNSDELSLSSHLSSLSRHLEDAPVKLVMEGKL